MRKGLRIAFFPCGFPVVPVLFIVVGEGDVGGGDVCRDSGVGGSRVSRWGHLFPELAEQLSWGICPMMSIS